MALTLVPDTDDAVTAVNTGEPITPTTGFEAVPPVYALTPGWTYVDEPDPLSEPIMTLRSVPAESMTSKLAEVALRADAEMDVNTGDSTTSTVGRDGVPPVVVFVPG